MISNAYRHSKPMITAVFYDLFDGIIFKTTKSCFMPARLLYSGCMSSRAGIE